MEKCKEINITQPSELTFADICILKERIGNMTPEEQEVVASELDTSVMERELHNRNRKISDSFSEIAVGLGRVKAQWMK